MQYNGNPRAPKWSIGKKAVGSFAEREATPERIDGTLFLEQMENAIMDCELGKDNIGHPVTLSGILNIAEMRQKMEQDDPSLPRDISAEIIMKDMEILQDGIQSLTNAALSQNNPHIDMSNAYQNALENDVQAYLEVIFANVSSNSYGWDEGAERFDEATHGALAEGAAKIPEMLARIDGVCKQYQVGPYAPHYPGQDKASSI